MDGALFRVEGGFPDGLRHRGMRVDGVDDLIQRTLAADGQSALRNQISGAGANDVHTEDLAILFPGDDLHKALAAVEDQSLAIGAHGKLAHLVLDALGLALLLGQAHGGGLRLNVNTGGVGGFIIVGLMAADVLRRHLAHGAGGVGQLGEAEK